VGDLDNEQSKSDLPSPQSPTESEPLASNSARQWLLQGIVLGLTTLILGIRAYYWLFSTFSDYDDEGYILISIAQFVRGHALYDEVFTQYGPAYYLLAWLLFKPEVISVNHETARCLTLAVWLACPLVSAILVLRLQGGLVLAALTQGLTFVGLWALPGEPGHPSGLSVLLLSLLPLLASYISTPRQTATSCIGIGIVVGFLLLTKINIGIFALLAVVFTCAVLMKGQFAAGLAGVAALAMLVLPVLLLRAHLFLAWGLDYALLVTLSAVAVILVGFDLRPNAWLRPRDGWIVAVASLATLLLILSAILVLGSSPSGVLDGVLLQHIKFPTIFFWKPPIDDVTALVALIGLVLCLGYRRFRDHSWALPLMAATKLLFGLFVIVACCLSESQAPYFLFLAVPFTWLAVVSVDESRTWPATTLARLLLVALTVMASLQAYPVPGGQRAFATFLIPSTAMICLGDGWRTLAPQGWSKHFLPRLGLAATLAGLLLVEERAARYQKQVYDQQVPLGLPGVGGLRLPQEDVALYRWLTENLRTHADSFVSQPGLNSLYFWAEQEPPTSLNCTTWMTLLDDSRQQQVIEQLARHPHACAVRADSLLDLWVGKEDIQAKPLVRYLREEFRPVGRFGSYEILVRKDRREPPAVQAPGPPADDCFGGR
jgi:hypothetical protein